VVAHELTHGVIQNESNLDYQDESGALNEHFADVMCVLVDQWRKRQTVDQADWYIGGGILGPQVKVKGVRTMTAAQAFQNDPYLGTDPQPKHMNDKYKGPDDFGGVHINSGIPNHAFYLVATALGGYAWEKAGVIWYNTLRSLDRWSNFQGAAKMTYQVAGAKFGAGSNE
jgi:Zn-dependent metalloprotease